MPTRGHPRLTVPHLGHGTWARPSAFLGRAGGTQQDLLPQPIHC